MDVRVDYKESWTQKNWCFWSVVLEKTLESPLDCKEIQPVHHKGDKLWVFIGGTDVEAETPILWPLNVKSWLIWKDPDAGRDWGQEEKGTTGWEGWMASPTQWTWVWVDSRSSWWTGRPGVLRFMGSQRVRHDWTELNWTDWMRGDGKRYSMQVGIKRKLEWQYSDKVDFKIKAVTKDKKIILKNNQEINSRRYYNWKYICIQLNI